MSRLLSALAEHAEDVALFAGTATLGIGVGFAYGFSFGLIAVGALCVAYGVWITERRPR